MYQTAKRIAKKRRRDDEGLSVIEVVVVMGVIIILGGLIYGGYLLLFQQSREFVLNNNLATAAETFSQRMSLNPEYAQTANFGDLESALAADFGSVDWQLGDRTNGSWPHADNQSTGDDTQVHVQFFNKGDDHLAPSGGTPGTLEWLVDGNSAARLIAQNSEGAWACALVVWGASVPESAIIGESFTETPASTTTLPFVSKDKVGKTKIEAWMSGIWYDSSDTPDTQSESRQLRCSPILTENAGSVGTGNSHASLPTAPNSWPIGNPEQSGTWTAVSGSFPESALAAGTAWTTLKPKIE